MVKLMSSKTLLLSTAFLAVLIVFGYGTCSAAKKVYISNAGNNTVSVIDTSKNEIVNTFRTGVWPSGMAIDPSSNRLYVVSSSDADSTITVIDLASNSEVGKIKVGTGPMSIAVDSASQTAYVANTEHMVDGKNLSHTISIVDLKTNKETGQVDVGVGPFDIKIVKDKIFTSNSGEAQIAAVSIKDRKLIKKAAVIDTPLGMAVSPDMKKIYVAIHGKGSVMVFDTGDVRELSTIKVGKAAWYIGIDEAKNKAYVTRSEENLVSVFDTKSDKVIGEISVGKGPRGVAVDSEAGRAYVVNHQDISVSVIDTSSDKVVSTIKMTPATESTYSGSPWGVIVH